MKQNKKSLVEIKNSQLEKRFYFYSKKQKEIFEWIEWNEEPHLCFVNGIEYTESTNKSKSNFSDAKLILISNGKEKITIIK